MVMKKYDNTALDTCVEKVKANLIGIDFRLWPSRPANSMGAHGYIISWQVIEVFSQKVFPITGHAYRAVLSHINKRICENYKWFRSHCLIPAYPPENPPKAEVDDMVCLALHHILTTRVIAIHQFNWFHGVVGTVPLSRIIKQETPKYCRILEEKYDYAC